MRNAVEITKQIKEDAPLLSTAGGGYLVCDKHNLTWCKEVEAVVLSGTDSKWIEPGDQVMVPMFPTVEIWAPVKIDESVKGISALMQLEYSPDFGNWIRINLGFWNPGEGRHSIRDVILDYIKSKVDPYDIEGPFITATTCPSQIHSIASEQKLRRVNHVVEKWVCLWNIVMEGACSWCINDSSTDFGLDGLDAGFRRA